MPPDMKAGALPRERRLKKTVADIDKQRLQMIRNTLAAGRYAIDHDAKHGGGSPRRIYTQIAIPDVEGRIRLIRIGL